MRSILIVDDDSRLRKSFGKLLGEEGYEVRTAASGETGLEEVSRDMPDLVIMDIRMPGIGGMEAFQAMREIDPKLPVIIMTAYGTTETAIEATKLGAYDYVIKPFEIPDLLTLIEQALDAGRFMRSRVEMNAVPEAASADAIIGQSQPMQEVYKTIGRVAPTEATVLIRGESGTGKELVAQAIYQHSRRANRPFQVINCVAIPETLLESELFGYEKGAFTGATNRRIGKIEQATGGTIFLDEIGDMPLSIQAKILRLLQEKNVERLGGRETIPVDVRIIAATNRILENLIADGRFREDLFYRLRVVAIELPSLREREGDTPLLCDYFLARFSRDMGIENPGLSEEAYGFVRDHPWPGNVRELANALQKALIFSRGYPIQAEDMTQAVRSDFDRKTIQDGAPEEAIRQWVRKNLVAAPRDDLFSYLADHFAGLLIAEALNFTRGNRTRAAKLLGISRPTLHARMDKLGLTGNAENGSD